MILKHIEELCGQPIHKLVDFVCGTSTGSVLSAMLCLERIDARNCQAYYHNFSTEIFKMNNLMGISRFFFSKHAFYDSKLLEGALRSACEGCDRLQAMLTGTQQGRACGRRMCTLLHKNKGRELELPLY